MSDLEVNYRDLSHMALIKIFELADLLGCTPKEAAVAWMSFKKQRAQREGRVLETAGV